MQEIIKILIIVFSIMANDTEVKISLLKDATCTVRS